MKMMIDPPPIELTEVRKFHSAEDAHNYVRWNMAWSAFKIEHPQTVNFLTGK